MPSTMFYLQDSCNKLLISIIRSDYSEIHPRKNDGIAAGFRVMNTGNNLKVRQVFLFQLLRSNITGAFSGPIWKNTGISAAKQVDRLNIHLI